MKRIEKYSLTIVVFLLAALTLSLFFVFQKSPQSKIANVDKLMQERVKTQEFQKAKKAGVKNMMVCYDILNKKGIIMLNKMPATVEDNELFENLVIYSNDIKHKKNNIVEVQNYNNNIKRTIDFNKEICRIYEINKL